MAKKKTARYVIFKDNLPFTDCNSYGRPLMKIEDANRRAGELGLPLSNIKLANDGE